MKIKDAQYKKDMKGEHNTTIFATIDGTEMLVPLDPDNRHYAEILKLV